MARWLAAVGFVCIAGSGALARDAKPRVVHADVVALDQLLVYNRFGSFDPFGMVFALRRDVSSIFGVGTAGEPPPDPPDAKTCGGKLGTEAGVGALNPGEVRLKDCKRPRPLVLRGNVGEILEVTVTNLLAEDQPGFSDTFCKEDNPDPLRREVRDYSRRCQQVEPSPDPGRTTDWPKTRGVSFVLPGLEPLPLPGEPAVDPRCLGLDAAAPNESFTCRWRLDREGTHLFSSLAAPAGGQGDGGSLTHGLFGALIVEPEGSAHYRSQVTHAAFDAAWTPNRGGAQHSRQGSLRYAEKASGDHEAKAKENRPLPEGARRLPCADDGRLPILAMRRSCGTDHGAELFEIVHGDLNAIIVPPEGAGEASRPFREFTVVFHDELKTFYTKHFDDLERFGQLSGVRDAFAINYGASGAGAVVIANRKDIGPAAGCVECLYEEFFLQSWANGDPALLERYPDDPSNVHHSYLNDKVVFRNLHAGPKETHVFHLHTHQWFAGNDENRGSYLDSQTIAPQQGFTYRIYHGGLRRFAPGRPTEGPGPGWWETLGAGNRNRTPGDAIFHCHLYPHFAQGMWELWRVHDVLEDGTRLLPDGQDHDRLSLRPQQARGGEARKRRLGSVNADTGEWNERQEGTPVPGLVPLPGYAAPLLPTYDKESGMPGYPFYIAGTPGHRAPQPPLDIARDESDSEKKHLDGGLPRHVVTNGERTTLGVPEALALGDLTVEVASLDLKLLPYDGTKLERRAMAFHHDGRTESGGALALVDVEGNPVKPGDKADGKTPYMELGGYLTPRIERNGMVKSGRGRFNVNGAPAAPGAPFADPCGGPDDLAGTILPRLPDGMPGPRELPRIMDRFRQHHPGGPFAFTPDPGLTGLRRFEVSAVQLDVVVNRAGWHDPQTRMNVLSKDAHNWKPPPGQTLRRADAEPFFFRGFSGECIEFRHTNETPKVLELDDFQVRAPTDTIGQHIHLVKFDVTSSDGSGNGFNYEDGTFAPDELLERICKAAKGSVTIHPDQPDDQPLKTELHGRTCADKEIWKERRQGHKRNWFQTTVQRWFADPILSETRGDPDLADRTLRTVFTHDHFAPSNIQQHGFYSALLIEPSDRAFCVHPHPEESLRRPETSLPHKCGERAVHRSKDPTKKPEPITVRAQGQAPAEKPSHYEIFYAEGDERSIGARASVASIGTLTTNVPDGDVNPVHPDFREFALAIADFALLYDGKPSAVLKTRPEQRPKGLERLVAEAEGLRDPDAEDERGEVPPASVATLSDDQKTHLRQHAEFWRGTHGRPIAPPPRPEAISQKHHDPYLVNYRNEPIPLRVGSYTASRPFIRRTRPCSVAVRARKPAKDLRRQREGEPGDLANVFRTEPHGDPCTPVLDAIQGDRVSFRLIQGAHEVQHMFTVEGTPFRRNGDHHFPSSYGFKEDGKGVERTDIPNFLNDRGRRGHWRRCQERALDGRPLDYERWILEGPGKLPFFARHEMLIAGCDNVEGYVAAQEIGISEHFELRASFRADANLVTFRRDSFDGAKTVATSQAAGPLPKSTDHLYHFGTIDALWNGAWSLLRVYEDENAPDLTACLAGRKSINQCGTYSPIATRLPVIGKLGDPRTEPAPQTLDFRKALPRAPRPAPSPACPPGAPEVLAAAAAVQANEVLSNLTDMPGLVYDKRGGLFDPNGLMLVAVDPAGLGIPQDALFSPAAEPWTQPTIDRGRIVAAAIKALRDPDGFTRQRPFVLRVNAGDCLRLAVLNGLPERLPDARGDALMPPIVPLNVDQPSYAREGGGRRADDLRPSSRIALVIPTSVVSPTQATPAPFGVNAGEAVGPVGTTQAGVNWYAVELYAGRLWVDKEELDKLVAGLSFKVDRVERAERVVAAFKLAPQDTTKPACLGEGVSYSPVVVVGRRFCVDADSVKAPDKRRFFEGLADAASRTRRAVQAQVARDVRKKSKEVPAALHEIPYAFGALPIKSLGDPIGHGPHGLMGTLIVEPKGATYPGRDRDPSLDSPLPITGRPMDEAARVSVLDVAGGKPADKATRARRVTFVEHALLWQDSLNHWDRAKTNRPERPDDPAVGDPYPNCRDCNDSYDYGEKGVSYGSANFITRLRGIPGFPLRLGARPGDEKNGESEVDLNAYEFPPRFLDPAFKAIPTPTVRVAPEEELLIRVLHPQGRARQRAFIPLGSNYEDLFLGFGSGHSALLAPGKGITAASCAPKSPGRYLWYDGAKHLFAGGVWGVTEVGGKPERAALCAAAR